MPDRPRDHLGRPLPQGDPATVPGPDLGGITSAAIAWQRGAAFIDQGLPFHAHEVFEERWRTCPLDEREAWQALAQWAAALTHRARGNSTGAVSVANSAREHLGEARRFPSEIDIARVRASLDDLASH